jgi:DNA methylase
LLGDDADLDFGIYQRINADVPELRRWIEHDLPARVTAECRDARERDEVFRWLKEFFDEAAADEPDDDIPPADATAWHVRPGGPLPHYAFRLPSGRRVSFVVWGEQPSDRSQSDPAARLVLDPHQPVVAAPSQLEVFFHRELLPERTKQSILDRQACRELLALASLADWVGELSACASKGSPSTLHRQLSRFTDWSESDLVFPCGRARRLRRRLDGFLARQLSVGSCPNDEPASSLVALVERARIVHALASELIGRVAARERLAARLWQSMPLVAETHYCVTLDRVPRELDAEIGANPAQHAVWREQLGLDDLPGAQAAGEFLSAEFLRAHPFLVVDTSLFSSDFRDRLLASIDDLDAAIDGVLIQGENSDALRLLGPRYADQVECIYLDPPYNTGATAWAYADRFHHLHWWWMMRERLKLARGLLASHGSIFVTLDDHEHARLRLLMERIYGPDNFLATIIWEKVHTRKNSARHFSVSHDYIPAFAKDKSLWQRQLLPRTNTLAYANPDGDPRGPWKADPVYANKPYSAAYQITKPNGVVLDPPPGRFWRLSEHNLLAKAASEQLVWGDGEAYPLVKRFLAEVQTGLVPVTLFTREFAGDNAQANAELRALFGEGRPVSYPKPSRLVLRLLQIATRPGGDGVVLDFFAGSGTTGQAVIELNRLDGGRRRYVLVEQADYFDHVLKLRITKCVYSRQWQGGRPVSRDGVSQMFQVLRLQNRHDSIGGDRLETFNWLLGLRVKRIEARGQGRIVLGTLPDGRRALVVWPAELSSDPKVLRAWIAERGYQDGEAAVDVIYAPATLGIDAWRSPTARGEIRDLDAEFERLLSLDDPAGDERV